MNFIDLFFAFLGGFISFWGCELTMKGLTRFRRPIVTQWEWKDIEKFLIPELDRMHKIFVTDGNEVDYAYITAINYNANGKKIWDYDKKVITHWSYFPSAPIQEKQ